MERSKKLFSILKETFGYNDFRFEQKNIIETITSKQDTLAIMPTGGGKSLCYQIPALYFDGLTIVISPLISLMEDQVNALRQHDISSAFYNSTLSAKERNIIENQIRDNELKLLYIAPEGILNDYIINLLKQTTVSLFAVDEAHCVSQWGHEFRSDYTNLYRLKQEFPEVPTIALTATADENTRKDICSQLNLQTPKTYISSFDRPNIKYMIHERINEVKQLNDFITAEHKEDTGIVYCLSRKKVERISDELCKLGFNAVPYHAGLSPETRSHHQNLFNTSDTIIVVATVAFGMGIDRPDVRFVAHLDLPKSIEGYYQETGRAGRDGAASNAWMIYGLQDVVKLSRMIEMGEAQETYKIFSKGKLDSMLSLCETNECRRIPLLRYFGKDLSEACQNCDTCLNPPDMWDATLYARQLISTILRTEEKFGAAYIIDVIRGSKNQKVLNWKHDKLSVYGIGREMPKDTWNSIIRQLLNQGYLTIRNYEYRSLGVTEKSRPLLKGEVELFLRKQIHKRGKFKDPASAKKSKSIEHLDELQTSLFNKLKTLRTRLSSENKVPPYVIFADKSLSDMCQLMPRNKEDMLMVHGVGEKKFDKYGSMFMEEIILFDSCK